MTQREHGANLEQIVGDVDGNMLGLEYRKDRAAHVHAALRELEDEGLVQRKEVAGDYCAEYRWYHIPLVRQELTDVVNDA